MPRRHVNWNMGKMYGRGWQKGVAETESDYKEWYHLDGITYPELYKLLVDKGRVTLRNNKYPMVMLVLSLAKEEEFYYILPIGQKFMWSRIDGLSSGRHIRIIWQGFQAQVLLRKLLRYMPSGSMKQKTLKALRWTPKAKEGGQSELTVSDRPEDISAW